MDCERGIDKSKVRMSPIRRESVPVKAGFSSVMTSSTDPPGFKKNSEVIVAKSGDQPSQIRGNNASVKAEKSQLRSILQGRSKKKKKTTEN